MDAINEGDPFNVIQSPPIETYANKKILAPMVRIGTLPFRLLALDYGADIVYSEEIIALKLQHCKRIYNSELGTIEFKAQKREFSTDSVVFSTNKLDHPNVLQLGASDAVTALQAATVVSRDVNGIDLNMGCPKHFSVQGGMGSALLKKPETVKDILSTLKRNLNNSITAKIRLLETVPATIDLMKTIEQTGVSALALHCRYVPDRPRDPAHWDLAKEVIANCGLSIPLIINGDVFKHEDINKVKEETKASSVMIARGALWNASIFQPQSESIDEVITKYLRKCIDLNNGHPNTKYVVMQMLQGQKHPNDVKVQHSKTMEDLCDLWGLKEYLLESRKISTENETEDEDLDGEICKRIKSSVK